MKPESGGSDAECPGQCWSEIIKAFCKQTVDFSSEKQPDKLDLKCSSRLTA